MGTLLEQEIREQPDAIARVLDEGREETAQTARWLRSRAPAYVVIAARGTSDNAARYAQYLLGERLGLPVVLAAPSLTSLYDVPAVPAGAPAVVAGISQSGRSPDIVGVLESARASGVATIALTNAGDSPLATAADRVLELRAGPERSVAATKTYTTSLAALALLAAELRDDDDAREALRALPDRVRESTERALAAEDAQRLVADAQHVVAVGRGYNLSTAFEVALKLRELTGRLAEGFSPADLMHGPIAALDAGTLAIMVAPEGRAQASVLETAEPLAARGVQTLAIAPGAGPEPRLPAGVPEWLSPIVAVVQGQVLALRAAEAAGASVDEPGGLTKVTETL